MIFYCNEQLGGIASLDFHLLTETSNWPTVLTDTTAGQIVITPEEVEVDAVLDEQTVKALANQRTASTGNTWTVKAEFTFLSRSESLEQIMDQYENQPGILIVCLNNGFKKMYGSNLEPLYLNFDVVEGTSVDDGKSGTNISIEGKLRQRPVYYTVSESSS